MKGSFCGIVCFQPDIQLSSVQLKAWIFDFHLSLSHCLYFLKSSVQLSLSLSLYCTARIQVFIQFNNLLLFNWRLTVETSLSCLHKITIWQYFSLIFVGNVFRVYSSHLLHPYRTRNSYRIRPLGDVYSKCQLIIIYTSVVECTIWPLVILLMLFSFNGAFITKHMVDWRLRNAKSADGEICPAPHFTNDSCNM